MAFTLVELLIVIVILGVMAAVVVPKFQDASLRGRESSLRANLILIRVAIERSIADTDLMPQDLADLAATTEPGLGVDTDNNKVPFGAGDWRGPYLDSIPQDPVSNSAWYYEVSTKLRYTVRSDAPGNGLNGIPYVNW